MVQMTRAHRKVQTPQLFRPTNNMRAWAAAPIGGLVGLVLPALGRLSSVVESDAPTLTVAQWNPHWQCFVGHPDCAGNATATLDKLLTETAGLDFANIIELEEAAYHPPDGWGAVGAGTASCGQDWDMVLYNQKRWKLLDKHPPVATCLYDQRSYALAEFELIGSDPPLQLAFVGAHFPQTLNASTHAYAEATATLADAIKATGQQLVVLAADTNTESPAAAAASPSHHGVNKTNAELMFDLGVWSKPGVAPPGSTLFKSCCFNDDFSWQGDRIIANFGGKPQTRVLFDPAPAWAAFDSSEFHKGVLLTMELSAPSPGPTMNENHSRRKS